MIDTVGRGHWADPTQVYLLRAVNSPTPLYKIGCSCNPEKRRGAVASQLQTQIELIVSYEAGRAARDLENAWLRFFRPTKRAAKSGPFSREWFYLNEYDVRLFRHLTYRVAKQTRTNEPEGGSWWWIFDRVNIEALRKRFGYT